MRTLSRITKIKHARPEPLLWKVLLIGVAVAVIGAMVTQVLLLRPEAGIERRAAVDAVGAVVPHLVTRLTPGRSHDVGSAIP